MLWHKTKHTICLKGGRGNFTTSAIHGRVDHLIINPKSKETIWSISIKDSDNDEIFSAYDIEGRLDDKNGLPVGLSTPEKLNVSIFDTTANEDVTVIFKVKEER